MNTANKALQRRRQTIIRWVKVSAGYYHCRSATPLVVINRLTCGPKRHVCGSLYRGLSAVASTDDYSKNASAVATTDVSGTTLPIIPIEFDIAAKIEGQESHIATIQLHPGETLRTESGAMLYMTDGVEMETKIEGIASAFSRMLTGQNLFFTDFRYMKETGSGTVCLGTDFPSKILRFCLDEMPNSSLICQKGAYLASNPTVSIEMEFTRSLTAGFFGGEGFVLQKLSGEGDVMVKGGGTVVRRSLSEGEVLRVTSGSLVAFQSTVSYEVQMVQGIRNAMFGGEGLFMTTLTGPGTIWLQGMPPDRMIAEIASRVPSGLGLGIGVPIGGTGASGGEASAGSAADQVGTAGAADAAVAGMANESSLPGDINSERAINADRNATVASSGIESESSSALFGDAVPKGVPSSTISQTATPTDSYGESSSSSQDSLFGTEMNEPVFDDNPASTDVSSSDGELFDDTSSSIPDADAVESTGGGLFSTFWNIFSGGDND